mmetsp:Transcript_4659/g.8074  ORF Transcript_4659/g.8074 Transcript_4659/m.8074 type:complete len:945 (+) Transcript_4659:415-3249(+)
MNLLLSAASKMRVRPNDSIAENKRTVPCSCVRTQHDTTKTSLALIVLIASLYSTHSSFQTDALSLSGRRLFRRHATETSVKLVSIPHDEPFDVSGSKSPAFTSPLFTSSSYRRDRRSRQLIVTQNRKKLFRRKGNFQLNYKYHDDEMSNIIVSQQPALRPSIFRRFKRKSLSKALFPPVVEDNYVDDDLVSYDQLDELQDTIIDIGTEEEVLELPTSKLYGIGKFRRKEKKNQVIVSNISELHEAILDRGLQLRDVELKYSPPPSLLSSKKQQPADIVENPASSKTDEVQGVLMKNELNPEYGEFQPIEFTSPQIELEGNNEPNAEEWQLIGNVLAEDSPFSMEVEEDSASLFSHDVLNLLHQRYHSQSTPMSRALNDTSILALSIEGGGMRGAVSGGMAAAISCLGLSNAFDSVYGSSAGSIIGSYFVSRQMYLDVYTDVIPAGKDLFVNKNKIIGDIFRNMFLVMRGPLGKRLNANLIERWNLAAGNNVTSVETLPPTRAGGLNISFVLDSIMCPEHGLRPLDLETFAHNDAAQPLRIVSSAVELDTGKLKSICFGSKEGHFRDQFANPDGSGQGASEEEYLYPVESAEADKNGFRRGLWACLGASMTVPGAAGSPFRIDLPSSHMNASTPHLCFDAFCYEPVPFRSAVAEGATHVVALRSRPAGYEPKTKPTLYERAVAPLYFKSNGVPDTVAEFFEKGGQQYLYAEDVLICDQGLNSTEPIPIPPAKVLYAAPGAQNSDGIPSPEWASDTDRNKWARAHLLPITVPADVPELSTLAHDRDDILAGIRSGFAAAYDALAPVVGLEAGPDSLDGMQVAELVFPEADAPHESFMETKYSLAGEKLGKILRAATEQEISANTHVKETAASADLSSAPHRSARFRRLSSTNVESSSSSMPTSPPSQHADALFSFLPGVQLGSLPMVAERLQTYLENLSYFENNVL